MTYGYALGKRNLNEETKDFKNLKFNAVELSFNSEYALDTPISRESIEFLKSKDYLSLHAPIRWLNGEIIYYKDTKEIAHLFDKIFSLLEKIKINMIVFHPDLVSDLKFIARIFGDKCSFEFMSKYKKFGKTTEDFLIIQEKCPNSKIVVDLQHMYCIDKDLHLAIKFHEQFSEQICHYHVSAVDEKKPEKHSCFIKNSIQQDIILTKGILKKEIPVIHEGKASFLSSEELIKEDAFLQKYLI